MIGGKFILELKSLSKVEIILRWKFKDNFPPLFFFLFLSNFPHLGIRKSFSQRVYSNFCASNS